MHFQTTTFSDTHHTATNYYEELALGGIEREETGPALQGLNTAMLAIS